MANKTIKTRLVYKHNTSANWAKIGDTFVPRQGELIVYDDLGTMAKWAKVGDKIVPIQDKMIV